MFRSTFDAKASDQVGNKQVKRLLTIAASSIARRSDESSEDSKSHATHHVDYYENAAQLALNWS
jgi:ribose 1,5-bisphosphokinase PhnN